MNNGRIHQIAIVVAFLSTICASNILAVDYNSIPGNTAFISQKDGERLIDELVADIHRKYPFVNKQENLLKFYLINVSNKIVLLKSTDAVVSMGDEGDPGVIEFSEASLAAGRNFHSGFLDGDPFRQLANFPIAPKYRSKFVALTHDTNPAVRVAATLVLGGMPHSSLIPVLTNLTHDPNPDVQLAAVWALGPDDMHVLQSFALEHEISTQAYIPIKHPYRGNGEVALSLFQFANKTKASEIPRLVVLLRTLGELREKRAIEWLGVLGSTDPEVNAYLKQCYAKLR